MSGSLSDGRSAGELVGICHAQAEMLRRLEGQLAERDAVIAELLERADRAVGARDKAAREYARLRRQV